MGSVFENNIKVDASGNATITGNLTVNGTTTTINSTTLTVDDKTIVIASGAADSSAADGAGISIDGASATLLYDHTGTQWEMNKPLEVTGAISSTSTITAGTDLTVTGGDIAFGATNSTVTVGATAHDAAGANLSISSGSTTAGTSNNQAGGSLTISGGQGKGSGAGGDIIFKTANAGSSGSSINSLATALTISDDKSATFEDNVTVKGDIILDDGGSIKEAGGTAAITIDGSGHVTKIGQDSLSSGDVLTYDGAKWVGEAPTTGDVTGVTAGTLLDGGGNSGAVTLNVDLTEAGAATIAAGDHVIFLDGGATGTHAKGSINDVATLFAGNVASSGLSASSGVLSVSDLHPVGVDGANNQILTDDGDGTVTSESKLTFDGTTLLVDSDVTATTNHTTIGAHIDFDATGIVASGQTGNNVGLDVDINSNSPTMVGTVNNIGLDIDLTGGTSGTQTNVGVDVNVSGADTNIAALFNGGNVGIGTAAPSQILQVAAAAPIVVVQNSTDQHGEGEAESKVLFADHAGNALGQIEGSHSGASDDAKGQFKVSTNNGSGIQLAMSIDDSQNAVFAGDLTIDGGDATLGTPGNTTATTIQVVTNTSTNVGKSLTIAAGSTTTGANDLNGGDLILKSGGGDGTGTSAMQFHTKISGADTAAERMRINTNGNVVINGSTAHAASLALDGATAAVALKEMANAPGDTAAFGQLWVKTATPNELYFTTDAGNDIQLTSGTSTAGGGGSVTANDASLILATRIFS